MKGSSQVDQMEVEIYWNLNDKMGANIMGTKYVKHCKYAIKIKNAGTTQRQTTSLERETVNR